METEKIRRAEIFQLTEEVVVKVGEMPENHDREIALAKTNYPNGNVFLPVSMAIAALAILLFGYAISSEYRSWPEPLQISSWFVLPAMMVLWGAVLTRASAPVQRSTNFHETSSKADFLKELRRERLRADRSKTSLSLAIFSFEVENSEKSFVSKPREFLNCIQATIRDTDILGYLGGGRIGLLLTDTDEKGLDAYIRKLTDEYGELPASIIAGTYPDQIFDNLGNENQECFEPCTFFLDVYHEKNHGYGLKRIVDILGAGVAIVIFSPLMLLTAIAIKANSPGPVIFRQTRLGENGKPFIFYKFRSMTWMADDRVHREYVTSLINGNVHAVNHGDVDTPFYKLKADPRVTAIGRIIRKTSIDELPQLFNVLKGDMSLVGPRPPLPYEAENYQSWHLRRIFGVKPGITGLWQVEGRCRTTFDDMVRLDLEYIENCSLPLDLKILLKTVKVVLQGSGAA